MVRHHHRTMPAIALTLALAGASSASARLELNPPPSAAQPSAAVSTKLCSEVCGAGGYTAAIPQTAALAATGAALAHDPRPRSQAISGAASASRISTIASSRSTGPRSEVVSGGGYTNPSYVPTVVRVAAPTGGFDWGDAGIGAGGALAMMILIGGFVGATNVRHRATRSTAQPTT
ncbi:MAG: hypothetical protein QOD66_2398 [Solirubrobacteraceae bacterium]|nr:hypothetical protein [Solirubrobacteraceae bacterium]